MEEKKKFKVGDRVRCIVAVDGNERVLNATGTVKGLRDYDVLVEFDKDVNGHNGGYTHKGVCKASHGWYCKFKSLELLSNETIVIYRKDNEVIALDKSTGKKAVAKCSPADEFNFNTGAKLALERLTRNVTFRVLCLDNKLTFLIEAIFTNLSTVKQRGEMVSKAHIIKILMILLVAIHYGEIRL